jgi:flavin-dependent dehydrogenase
MDVEVVIVGGGPAGCASALALRAMGHSVAVISDPRCKTKPTETATPQLKTLLRQVDADAALSACEPCFGISSAWGRPSQAVHSGLRNPLGNAWFIHRSRFDRLLQNATRQAGAQWIDAHVSNISFNSVGASIFADRQRVTAQWLVLAAGSPSFVGRITNQKPQNLDSLFALWAHIPSPFEARMIFVEPTDKGWWYVCPDDGQGAIACFVTDGHSARSLPLRDAANWNQLFRMTTISQDLCLNASATFVSVASIGLSALPKKHGQNWIVVGDASVKVDPIGSSGTVTALDSGRRAAKAVSDALRGELTNLTAYEKWSSDLFEAFVRQRERQYAIERLKRRTDFWSRRELQAA